MSEYARQGQTAASWIRERIFLNLPMAEYIKGLFTPFNVVAAVLILPGLYMIGIRFTQGLGAVTSAYSRWELCFGG